MLQITAVHAARPWTLARASTVLVAALGVWTVAVPAQAYRTSGDLAEIGTGSPVPWSSARVEFELGSNDDRTLSAAEFQSIAVSALDRWDEATCGGLELVVSGWATMGAASGDRRNTITFVAQGWAARGLPAGAGAFTDVVYERQGGEHWVIVEADIYINSDEYRWGASDMPQSGVRDLNVILTHEVGHALGLLHPCEEAVTTEAPVCATDTAFGQTVMYPVYVPGNLNLSPDDRAGLCVTFDCSGCYCSSPGGCVPEVPGCGGDSDCEPGYFCSAAGHCETGDKLAGSTCERSSQCLRGVCDDRGVCVATCATDDECGGIPGSCVSSPARPDAQVCAGAGVFGDPCASGSTCQSGVCLQGTSEGARCTRACESDAQCPLNWACGAVDEEAVCVPLTVAGGCSLAPQGTLSTERNRLLAACVLMMISSAAMYRRAFCSKRPRRAA